VSYDNTNSGVLFKNKEKKTEKHPDYRGEVNVGGTEFFLAAWLKKSKAGETYMSLSVTEKNANNTRSSPKEIPKSDDFDDDLPF
jgi:uncharacterized protein (DUF736 family)